MDRIRETGHAIYHWNGAGMDIVRVAGQHPWRLGEFVPALCLQRAGRSLRLLFL